MSEPLPCRHCRETEEDHHPFEAVVLPRGCKCDWREWGCDLEDIPQVCAGFSEDEDTHLCYGCEHLEECHE
jgi:hypothetical protein